MKSEILYQHILINKQENRYKKKKKTQMQRSKTFTINTKRKYIVQYNMLVYVDKGKNPPL